MINKDKPEARAAAKKAREAWMAEVDQRWAAYLAKYDARPRPWPAAQPPREVR